MSTFRRKNNKTTTNNNNNNNNDDDDSNNNKQKSLEKKNQKQSVSEHRTTLAVLASRKHNVWREMSAEDRETGQLLLFFELNSTVLLANFN